MRKNLLSKLLGASFFLVAVIQPAPALANVGGNSGEDVVARVYNSTDPLSTFNGLSSEDKESFNYYLLPARVAIEEVIVPADGTSARSVDVGNAPGTVFSIQANGCWLHKASATEYSLAGIKLYSYYTTLRWCASGSRVTSASVYEADGQSHAVGWRYEGVKARNAGIVGEYGRAYARHRFVLGIGPVDAQTTDNCMRAWGHYDGVYTWRDKVCGVW